MASHDLVVASEPTAPTTIGQGDGFTVMEQVVVAEDINKAIAIGICCQAVVTGAIDGFRVEPSSSQVPSPALVFQPEPLVM